MNKDNEKIFEDMKPEDGLLIAACLEGADIADSVADNAVDADFGCAKERACTDCGCGEEYVCTDCGKKDELAESDAAEENKIINEQKKEDINGQKIGKFKNPQELLRAYGELEREFTRRSQRLKELESGRRAAVSEEDWKTAVDKFFKEIPSAKAFAKDIANEIVKNPDLREDANCLNIALMKVLSDKFRTPEQLMNDGQFLNDYVLNSEKVRDAVIAKYLDGVRQGEPPLTIRGGGLQCAAPKVKPKTIEEAGFMFLKNNK